MAVNAAELAKRLAALTERFSSLAETLAQTAQQLQTSGDLPAESLIDEITKVRTDFVDVRHRVLEAARSLSINAPAMSEIDSLKVLQPVLDTVAHALATHEKKAALSEARTRVLTVLDRVLTVSHIDGPNFAALVQCQAKAREIREAALDPKAFDTDNAPAFLESTPSFAALLSIIEGRDALDDEKFAAFDETVTQSFGRALAVAAARGKLVIGAPRAPVVERVAPPPAKEPTARPELVIGAGRAPIAERAAPPPAKEPAARPELVIGAGRAPVAGRAAPPPPREPATRPSSAPPPPVPATQPHAASAPAVRPGVDERETAQAVGHGTQDEVAQWWVSAWARWTSWKGTLSFAAAVKEELGKYNYVLSVPIQKSTDYEDGLLAYGYSILLEHIEHRHSGFVNKALNSLKTFQPGSAGQSDSVGAHLYNVLVSEGRLPDEYPEFVKSVLLAAVPEPGLWTHARILESTTETRIFTHPSNRIGDPEHNSQRLTQERQRFADHRFPVVAAPITTRFFAIAADLKEPRSIDVKLTEAGNDSDHAWLMTMPPVGRSDLKAEVLRLLPEGTSVAGLGRDYATLWVAVFNPDAHTERKYELTLSLRQSAKQSAGAVGSAKSA